MVILDLHASRVR